jgi:orotate phosphoribosyltransferase
MSDQVQSSLVSRLARIGGIQFGYFAVSPNLESGVGKNQFAPVAFHFPVLPSYPDLMLSLANELARLVEQHSKELKLTHILASPSVVPLATAVSLITHRPLVYPTVGTSQTIEGAYDFNVPTLLLTDVITDGQAELAIMKRVAGLGLDVKAVVAVLDLGVSDFGQPSRIESLPMSSWQRFPTILPQLTTPALQTVTLKWLNSLRQDHR